MEKIYGTKIEGRKAAGRSASYRSAHRTASRRAASHRAASHWAAADRRLSKKLDSLCLAASVVIIAVTALLELRDRRISGERPLR